MENSQCEKNYEDNQKESLSHQKQSTQSPQMVTNTPCSSKKNNISKCQIIDNFINEPSTSNDIYNMNQLFNQDDSSSSSSKNDSSEDENDYPNINEGRDFSDEEKKETPPCEESIISPCTPNNPIPFEERSTEKAYPSQIDNSRFRNSQKESNSSEGKENVNSNTQDIINNHLSENKTGTLNESQLLLSLTDEKTSKSPDMPENIDKKGENLTKNKINNIDSFEDILITTSQLNELDNFCNKMKNTKVISSLQKEEISAKDSGNSNYSYFNFPLPSINWSQRIQEEKKRLRNITKEISYLNNMLKRVRDDLWDPKFNQETNRGEIIQMNKKLRTSNYTDQ